MTYLVFDVVTGQASFSYTEKTTHTAETRELVRSNTYPGGWPYVVNGHPSATSTGNLPVYVAELDATYFVNRYRPDPIKGQPVVPLAIGSIQLATT